MFENIVIPLIPGENNIFYKSINSGFNKKSYTFIKQLHLIFSITIIAPKRYFGILLPKYLPVFYHIIFVWHRYHHLLINKKRYCMADSFEKYGLVTRNHFRWQNRFSMLLFADKFVTENAVFAWKKQQWFHRHYCLKWAFPIGIEPTIES